MPQPRTLSKLVGDLPAAPCRAWVNFNGQGTVAIRASFNVSSITDVGTGLYRVNFANAMPDENFCAVVTSEGPVHAGFGHCFPTCNYLEASTTSRVNVSWFFHTDSGRRADPAHAMVAVFR